MNNFYLLWGGKFAAKLAYNILKSKGENEIVIFDKNLKNKFFDGEYTFINDEEKINKIFYEKKSIYLSICIGNNEVRKVVYENLSDKKNINFVNIISDKIITESKNNIGYGNTILSGTNLDFDIKIGNFNIINNNSVLIHDTNLGDYNFLGPNVVLCGNVKLGNNIFIGSNAVLAPDVSVGDNSIIGAGAVIRKNVPENIFIAGNPGSKIRDL